MCEGCYNEAGRPVPGEAAIALAPILRACDPFGPLHIIVEDWNVDDKHIEFCASSEALSDRRPKLFAHEIAVLDGLRALSEDQRYAALAVADGYWTA